EKFSDIDKKIDLVNAGVVEQFGTCFKISKITEEVARWNKKENRLVYCYHVKLFKKENSKNFSVIKFYGSMYDFMTKNKTLILNDFLNATIRDCSTHYDYNFEEMVEYLTDDLGYTDVKETIRTAKEIIEINRKLKKFFTLADVENIVNYLEGAGYYWTILKYYKV
ncbi:MAG: hypothetical protein ACRC0V_00280, partial [Fusobacteriaceae bacterium]